MSLEHPYCRAVEVNTELKDLQSSSLGNRHFAQKMLFLIIALLHCNSDRNSTGEESGVECCHKEKMKAASPGVKRRGGSLCREQQVSSMNCSGSRSKIKLKAPPGKELKDKASPTAQSHLKPFGSLPHFLPFGGGRVGRIPSCIYGTFARLHCIPCTVRFQLKGCSPPAGAGKDPALPRPHLLALRAAPAPWGAAEKLKNKRL